MDASKAFDMVNHWSLFKKLIKRGFPILIVRLLIFWYSTQKMYVKWKSFISPGFYVTNGVKQGGILSPYLFNIYTDDQSKALSSSLVGCNLNGIFVNHVIYADDITLIAPCASALQKLINICNQYASCHNIKFNPDKTVCMLFKSAVIKLYNTPTIYLGNKPLKYVQHHKCLGYEFSEDLSDDKEIKKQIRKMYASCNMLIRRFYLCSHDVKVLLFNSFCTNFYCSHLWWKYTKDTMRKMAVAFNNCFRKFIGYDKRCSASGMLTFNNTLSFNSLRRKSILASKTDWTHAVISSSA